ncbi:MAG TPA: alpha/beta hydrolase [Pirellulales bacterium]|jgi:acetyl esterase/lipase|nr:alpha/beta hydrolase [Pirellulales bacterium]
MKMPSLATFVGSLCIVVSGAFAADEPKGPTPTMANVPYGAHERQVLDFYRSGSSDSAPLVFVIHGGGWRGGDKATAIKLGAEKYLAAGLAVVSINYRYVQQAQEAGVKPPVEWPLHDAARALQFVRSKANEWNIDPKRVGATGSSAGACSSLWLAFHPDMADPASDDPVARESTRLTCAGVFGAQTCLDPRLMREWMPNMAYGGHAFGFFSKGPNGESPFEQFYQHREEVLPWIKEYSPYNLVSKDDPPVMLEYSAPIDPAKLPKDPTHSAIFGVKLAEKIHEVGGTVYLTYPDGPECTYPGVADFLITTLQDKQ